LGIKPLIPSVKDPFMNIRVKPGDTIKSRIQQVVPSLRPEHVLMIAVKAEKQSEPVGFEWLAQPSLESARKEQRIRGARSNDDSETGAVLTQFLEHFAFPETRDGAPTVRKIPSYNLRVLTCSVRGD
jgi:hypothetical protein